MSMQDKNILRPVLMNYGKGSNVLSGENGHGKRIVVLYHAHLLSSESVLILQSVLEQNENDISIWITSEIPVIQRIRDWFVEVGVSSENDKSFDKMKQANEHINHNWHDIFKNKILQWKNSLKMRRRNYSMSYQRHKQQVVILLSRVIVSLLFGRISF